VIGGVRIVFCPYVFKGKVYPHPTEPNTWIAHSKEDFIRMYDNHLLGAMGIEATDIPIERFLHD
jgi:hypothetical protein